jgi:hypothetical protein
MLEVALILGKIISLHILVNIINICLLLNIPDSNFPFLFAMSSELSCSPAIYTVFEVPIMLSVMEELFRSKARL